MSTSEADSTTRKADQARLLAEAEAADLAAYIRKVVDAAPPFGPTQRALIAELLGIDAA